MSLVVHPKHYNVHPSGVECIDIIKHMNFCCGSAIKYIWRADHKGDDVQDLEKAIFLLKQEIKRRKDEAKSEEERSREADINKYIESDWAAESKGGQTDHKERSMPNIEHKIQYDKAWEDYFRTQGTYRVCPETEGV
jgi:hypothetical protein